ncbi:hypothetical protein JCM11641_001808, partial [Rhodosporidiobolus odoratus]
MILSRFGILSLLAASSVVSALPTNPAAANIDLARRSPEAVVGDWATLEKRDEADLHARAIAGLYTDLEALVERSTNSVAFEKRGGGGHCTCSPAGGSG